MHIFSLLFHSDNHDKCMWIGGGFAGKFEVFFLHHGCRVVLFSSQEKADLYLPEVTPECAVIVSKTGKLCDIDTKAAQIAISTIGQESLVAA